MPGTTRDRSYGNGRWIGRDYIVVDTGGLVTSTEGDQIKEHIAEQALMALIEADIILFVVDCMQGLDHDEITISKFLKTNQKIPGKEYTPEEAAGKKDVFLVINKVDNYSREEMVDPQEWKQLGIARDCYMVSASHGSGVGDLLDDVLECFGPDPEPEDPKQNKKGKKKNRKEKIPIEDKRTNLKERQPESVRLALIGQPNAGKSSLLNRILGEDRSVVSPIAGTTMDPVDVDFDFEGSCISFT